MKYEKCYIVNVQIISFQSVPQLWFDITKLVS